MAKSDTDVSRDVTSRHDVPRDGRSGFVVVDDRQVHYLEWGPSAAAPVLALHGGGQTAYMFEELGSALRSSHHLLAPDLPSHGDSDPLSGDGGFLGRHALAETIPPLLGTFGLDRVAVVGASLGGITSLTLAASRPDLVSAIVLIDVGHRLEEEGVQRIIAFMSQHDSFASLDEAADAIAAYLPHRSRANPTSLRRNLRQRSDGRWVWKHGLSSALGRQAAGTWRDILTGLDADARQVVAPVLLLRGAKSDVLSATGAEEVASLLPNARIAEVQAAGHLAAGDNPASTVNLVRDFLREVGW
jgi:non-heme chloroperoxidase